MELVNLTNHGLDLYLADGRRLLLPAPERPARVDTGPVLADVQDAPMPLFVEFEQGVVDLPAPRPGVVFVVSTRVRLKSADRADLASPSDLVLDSRRRVVGCRSLTVSAGRAPAEPV